MRSRYSSFMDRIFKREERTEGEMSDEVKAKIAAKKEKFQTKIEAHKAKRAAKKAERAAAGGDDTKDASTDKASKK